MKTGEFERIRPHLTPLECGIIFDGIPEGAISRKVGLIWGIPVKDIRYPGAGWSPAIRSSTCRNTSLGAATSAS